MIKDAFKRRLLSIKEELASHKRSRTDILMTSIKERLSQSLKQYKQELDNSIIYLSKRDEINITRKLEKEENEKCQKQH